jgi:hypothetical protein
VALTTCIPKALTPTWVDGGTDAFCWLLLTWNTFPLLRKTIPHSWSTWGNLDHNENHNKVHWPERLIISMHQMCITNFSLQKCRAANEILMFFPPDCPITKMKIIFLWVANQGLWIQFTFLANYLILSLKIVYIVRIPSLQHHTLIITLCLCSVQDFAKFSFS